MGCGCGQQGGERCTCRPVLSGGPTPLEASREDPEDDGPTLGRSGRLGPLGPRQAVRTLAQKLAPLADRMRQLNTRFGIRPYRVFMNWTLWNGEEAGQGHEELKRRVEILPTPLVKSLDALAFSAWHAGTLQVGSVKVSEVSVVQYSEDQLRGLDPRVIPGLDLTGVNVTIPEPWDFFYEVVEDGRAGPIPDRPRFRLANTPFRQAEKMQWTFMLERTERQRTRKDKSPYQEPERGP